MTDRVDLNCDMGESFGAYQIGADDEVFPFITSANVACGFHGGDPSVMRATIATAQKRGVAVGAPPGLPDLLGLANAAGAALQHVKPHGALYNMAAANARLAAAIARAVHDVDRGLVLF